MTIESWAQVRLEELTTKVGSGSTPRGGEAAYKASGTPFIRSMNVVFFGFRSEGLAFIDDEQAEALKSVEVHAGDVLLNITGASIGRVTLTPVELHGARVSQHVCIIRATPAIDARYLRAFLSSPELQAQITAENYGVTRQALTKQQILEFQIPLAPVSEQRRIADKLDALLGRVDACRERLDRVPAILKRFRQAVLAAATTGELTRDWREQRSDELPWRAFHLAELGELGRGKSKHRPRNDPQLYGGPYPFIQTGDVAQSGGAIEHHDQTYSELGLAQSKLWPAGTVCITIAANIADTAILTYPTCFPDSVVGFVADPGRMLPEFAKWSIEVISDRLESLAPATAQKNINLAILSGISLPCPDVQEQAEIVRRVRLLLELANDIEGRSEAIRQRVERLTPSTLAKAFRGELVPQDPSDEPAATLLARERSASGDTPRRHRRRTSP